MSFLDELAEEVDSTGAPRVRDALGPYVVEDIGIEGQERGVVLLLESPHSMEVCRGHPLAGDSGLYVTRALSSTLSIPEAAENCPLGGILYEPGRRDVPSLRRIGLMNVSRLPMQSSVYPENVQGNFDRALFSPLKRLRDPAAVTPTNQTRTMAIKRIIVRDLRRRIECAAPNAYFIPCGAVARAFFCKATRDQGGQPLDAQHTSLLVPHPSRGQWAKAEHAVTITCLRGEIESRIR